jgi:hypothetical protein
MLQTFDMNAWLVNHGAEVTQPPLDKVIAALKKQDVSTFGASGHCLQVILMGSRPVATRQVFNSGSETYECSIGDSTEYS